MTTNDPRNTEDRTADDTEGRTAVDMQGRTAVDVNGAKIGKIGQVYVDDRSGQPLWVTIGTGLLGMKESFAPVHGSRSDGGSLRLAVSKDMIKDAPGVETDAHIKDHENEALRTYYEGYIGGSAQDAAV